MSGGAKRLEKDRENIAKQIKWSTVNFLTEASLTRPAGIVQQQRDKLAELRSVWLLWKQHEKLGYEASARDPQSSCGAENLLPLNRCCLASIMAV